MPRSALVARVLAAQLLAAFARARQVRELAEIVSASALNATDQLYLTLASTFEQRLVNQHRGERRDLDDTLDRCWEVADVLPRRELTMLPSRLTDPALARRLGHDAAGQDPARTGRTAERGRNQLDHKLRILLPERQRLLLYADICRREWLSACKTATIWQVRAAVLGG